MQTLPSMCDLYKIHKTLIHLVYFKSIFHRVYTAFRYFPGHSFLYMIITKTFKPFTKTIQSV